MNTRYYVMEIHQTDNGHLSAHFPDLPGCITGGADMADLIASAEEALEVHISGLHEDKDPIPDATPLESLPRDPDAYGYGLVRADMPASFVRVNISIDESLLRRIDSAASREQTTRSGWLASLARDALKQPAHTAQ